MDELKRQATKQGAWVNRLFNTHPPLEERIAALQEGLGAVADPAATPR